MANLVDTKQASEILGISVNTLKKYRMIGGGPPFLKFGRTVRYATQDLSDYIASRRYNNTAQFKAAN